MGRVVRSWRASSPHNTRHARPPRKVEKDDGVGARNPHAQVGTSTVNDPLVLGHQALLEPSECLRVHCVGFSGLLPNNPVAAALPPHWSKWKTSRCSNAPSSRANVDFPAPMHPTMAIRRGEARPESCWVSTQQSCSAQGRCGMTTPSVQVPKTGRCAQSEDSGAIARGYEPRATRA